jgi:hypothetical protein
MKRKGTKTNPFQKGEDVMLKGADFPLKGKVVSVSSEYTEIRCGRCWAPMEYEVLWEDARWPTKHRSRDLVAVEE